MSPGKFVARIRITKLDGNPITYKEALLRSSVDLSLAFLGLITFLIVRFQISNVEHYRLLSWQEKSDYLENLTPIWSKVLMYISDLWLCSELVVLLLNKKKRALHDFIAGTVVIHVKCFEEASNDNSTIKSKFCAAVLASLFIVLFMLSGNYIGSDDYYFPIKVDSKKESVLAKLKLTNSEYLTNENGVIVIKYKPEYLRYHSKKKEWPDSRFELIFANDILVSIIWVNLDNSLVEEKTKYLTIPLPKR